jgi:hypothetical protein
MNPTARRWFITPLLLQWRYMTQCGDYDGPFYAFQNGRGNQIDTWRDRPDIPPGLIFEFSCGLFMAILASAKGEVLFNGNGRGIITAEVRKPSWQYDVVALLRGKV